MKKMNNKGFMLAELLAVTVAILVIFMAIYQNYYPTMGEYEKRMQYNNIDSEYATFYTRVMYLNLFKNQSIEKTFFTNNFSETSKYVKLIENGTCNSFNFGNDFVAKCNVLAKQFDIKEAILAKYDTTDIKSISSNLSNFTDYINTLPKYTLSDEKEDYITKINQELYRLFVKTSSGYSNMQLYSSSCEYDYSYTFYNTNVNLSYENITDLVVKYSDMSETDCSLDNIDNKKCEKLYCTDNCGYGIGANQSNWTTIDCTSEDICYIGYRIVTIQDNNVCKLNETCSYLQTNAYRYKTYLNNNNFSVTSCEE